MRAGAQDATGATEPAAPARCCSSAWRQALGARAAATALAISSPVIDFGRTIGEPMARFTTCCAQMPMRAADREEHRVVRELGHAVVVEQRARGGVDVGPRILDLLHLLLSTSGTTLKTRAIVW